jgi:hypothetical protein
VLGSSTTPPRAHLHVTTASSDSTQDRAPVGAGRRSDSLNDGDALFVRSRDHYINGVDVIHWWTRNDFDFTVVGRHTPSHARCSDLDAAAAAAAAAPSATAAVATTI